MQPNQWFRSNTPIVVKNGRYSCLCLCGDQSAQNSIGKKDGQLLAGPTLFTLFIPIPNPFVRLWKNKCELAMSILTRPRVCDYKTYLVIHYFMYIDVLFSCIVAFKSKIAWENIHH